MIFVFELTAKIEVFAKNYADNSSDTQGMTMFWFPFEKYKR